MTTSQIQRRLVNFLPHSATTSVSWAGPPHLHLTPVTHSLTQYVCFALWKLNLKPPQPPHTHFPLHTTFLFTPSRQRVSALKWQISLGSFSMGNTTPAPPTPSLITHYSHHPPLTSSPSVTHSHALIRSVTSLECQYCFSERVAEWT